MFLLVLDAEEIGVTPPGVGVCGLDGIGGNCEEPDCGLPPLFALPSGPENLCSMEEGVDGVFGPDIGPPPLILPKLLSNLKSKI
jgi:hypothetical protein